MQESLRDVGLFFRMDERLQRMGGAVGIPERQRGVIREVALVNFAVGTAIFAIHIVEHRGRNHRVVEGGVENGWDVGRSLDFDFRQFIVPRFPRCSDGFREIPIGQFCLQIFLRILDAHRRQRHFYE